MKKKTHFVPRSDLEFVTWADHLASSIQTDCCGISEAELVDFRAMAYDYREKLLAAENAQLAAKQATILKRKSRQVVEGMGRSISRRVKLHPDYNKGLGAKLGLEGAPTSRDLSAAVPDLTVINKTGGTVELRFSKRGSDGVNIYYQRDNDREWILVGRALFSPFQDIRQLLVPGQPEIRRYTAVYMKRDQEISRYSDDMSLVCTP